MLPRHHRLTHPADYRAVLRGGDGRRRRRAGTDLIVVHAATPAEDAAQVPARTTTPTRPPRVGFVVSKAVGGSVVRHRVLRRLRHVVVDRLPILPDGADLVVRAQPATATATSAELAAALDQALARVLPGMSR